MDNEESQLQLERKCADNVRFLVVVCLKTLDPTICDDLAKKIRLVGNGLPGHFEEGPDSARLTNRMDEELGKWLHALANFEPPSPASAATTR
jgi:hypothetical protein